MKELFFYLGAVMTVPGGLLGLAAVRRYGWRGRKP